MVGNGADASRRACGTHCDGVDDNDTLPLLLPSTPCPSSYDGAVAGGGDSDGDVVVVMVISVGMRSAAAGADALSYCCLCSVAGTTTVADDVCVTVIGTGECCAVAGGRSLTTSSDDAHEGATADGNDIDGAPTVC
jgi:hypothetical protein